MIPSAADSPSGGLERRQGPCLTCTSHQSWKLVVPIASSPSEARRDRSSGHFLGAGDEERADPKRRSSRTRLTRERHHPGARSLVYRPSLASGPADAQALPMPGPERPSPAVAARNRRGRALCADVRPARHPRAAPLGRPPGAGGELACGTGNGRARRRNPDLLT